MFLVEQALNRMTKNIAKLDTRFNSIPKQTFLRFILTIHVRCYFLQPPFKQPLLPNRSPMPEEPTMIETQKKSLAATPVPN